MFSDGAETQADVNRPKNGPVPGRPVNGYARGRAGRARIAEALWAQALPTTIILAGTVYVKRFGSGRNGLLAITNFSRRAGEAKSTVAVRDRPLPLRATMVPMPLSG